MNGNGGSRGWLLVLVVVALIGGGGYLIYKNRPGGKPADTGKVADTGKQPPEPEEEPGPYKTGPRTVKADEVVEVPFIFWGGDVATFHANGGLETQAESLFGKHGLKCRLTPGDDFDKQVDNYLADKTPFLRGTLSMLGQASDKLTAKADTMPVVFLQLTWSAGDHLVGREALTKLDQLKGKKIALQEGGPHVGMLNDILRTAQLQWKDVNVVWTKDVTGANGPAAKFRADKSVDACFAITPDMMQLTSAPESGGINSVGDGTKESVKGAHVVLSTQHMARSIADVYACRKDFYDDNREWIDKFVAGYIKGCEELVDVKNRAADNKDKDQKEAKKRYSEVLKLAQDIWLKDPALKDQVAKEEDLDGLVSDANFVGLPGNESFFKAKGNLSGFDFKQKQALRLPPDPSKDPLKTDPKLFRAAKLNYKKLRELGDLRGVAPDADRFHDLPKGGKDDEIVYSFEVAFEANQSTFPEAQYGEHFKRALELASLYGNMTVGIRAHADPSVLVQRLVTVATDRGLIKGKGNRADHLYVVVATGKEFDPSSIDQVLGFIKDHPGLPFQDRGARDLGEVVAGLQKLSEDRSAAVQEAVNKYAGNNGLLLEKSQFQAEAVGIHKPKKVELASGKVHDANRRVEFSINKVPLESVNAEEFRLVK